MAKYRFTLRVEIEDVEEHLLGAEAGNIKKLLEEYRLIGMSDCKVGPILVEDYDEENKLHYIKQRHYSNPGDIDPACIKKED